MENKQAKNEYPESFRKQVALKVIGGMMTANQARKAYGIGGKLTVYNWVSWYKQYGVCTFNLTNQTKTALRSQKPMADKQSDRSSITSSEQRIKQLEQQLEDERLLKEMYQRMIEMAEQEHNIAIRKKINTK